MARKDTRTAGADSLDGKGRRLLLALSADGRRSAAALAKQLGLSRQAVAERIRDLERRGVIRGYRADVDPAALGLEVLAHVVCRRIEDVNALLADLQATRAIQSSRTAFVLETVLEKGAFGAVEGPLVPEA